MSSPAVAIAVPPHRLSAAVGDAVRAAKGDDPMTQVLVAVPSSIARRTVRNVMAVEHGLINVSFETLASVASVLTATAELDDPANKLSADVRRELARFVSGDARPPLNVHAGPSLVESLLKAFSVLRPRPYAEVEALASTNPLVAELVRLFSLYRHAAQLFQDSRDIIEKATELVGLQTPCTVLVVAQPIEPFEQEFVAALADAEKLSVVVLTTGDVELDARVVSSLPFLVTDAEEPRPAVTPSVYITPDADIEVQRAISLLLERAAAGVPFAKMALLFGTSTPYALLAHEHLQRAGIPFNGQSPYRLMQTAVGRFFLGLLQVIENDFSFDSVQNWLTAAPLLANGSEERLPVEHWLAVARKARVVRGDHWQRRLELLIQERETEKRGAMQDIGVARRMMAFVDDAKAWANSDRTTWSQWTDWGSSAVRKYLGTAEQRKDWPRNEQDALWQIEETFTRLSRLDRLGLPVDRDAFTAAMTDELYAAQSKVRANNGIFVGLVEEAIGAPFDVTVICGLAEGVYPANAVEDGFLAPLRAPGEERRVDGAARQFQLAIQCAGELLLTSPRADQRAQREVRPSPWLLQLVGERSHEVVGADEVLDGAMEGVDVLPSYAAFTGADGLPPSDDHATLRSFAATGLAGTTDQALVRGARLIAARAGAEGTTYDGVVGAHVSLALDASRVLSASAIENWASCPFKYFLRTELRIDEPADEDAPFQLDPRDRGNLLHAVLEKFVQEAAPRSDPGQDWSFEERARLHQIADEQYQQAFDEGRLPDGLLREGEIVSVHEALDAFCERDVELRRQAGVLPGRGGVEVAFGFDEGKPVLVPRANGVPVAFRGRIDRVDVSPDGSRAVAYDYKSGKQKKFTGIEKDPVDEGKHLQLALYGEALKQARPEFAHIRSGFWFVNDGEKGYPVTGVQNDDRTAARLTEVVSAIGDGIETGVFPAIPGDERMDSYENCAYCPYDSVCPAERAEAWQRKQSAKEVGVVHELTRERSTVLNGEGA